MTSTSKRYCSVSQCSSYKSKDVSLYYFPHSSPKLCTQWQHILNIGKPISKYMNVCSKHFSTKDFVEARKSTKYKRLKKGAIPSKNLPKESVVSKFSKTRNIGIWRNRFVHQGQQNIQDEMLRVNEDEPRDLETVTESESIVQERVALTTKEFSDKSIQTDPFQITDILNSDSKLKIFTSVERCTLENIIKCTENITLLNGEFDANLKLKIVLVLMKLKLNVPFTSVSILFSLSESTATRYFYSTLANLAAAIKPAIYWPSNQEILANMPKCFSNFKSTRVVLDSIEIPVQKCECSKCRSVSYSLYKGTNTIKFLIGITPSGVISFLSAAYGGRSSDKGVFNKENPHDGIMVDKEFLIESECNENLVRLIRPPFLRKQTKLSKSDLNKAAQIARGRVHVERIIQRLKNYKILNDEIECFMLPYINEIMTVCAALVNWSAPIHSNDKF